MMMMVVHKGTHLQKAGSSVSLSFLIIRFMVSCVLAATRLQTEQRKQSNHPLAETKQAIASCQLTSLGSFSLANNCRNPRANLGG
jgi:hypothetical protein